MSQFSERFDTALQILGFPLGSVAFDLARTPNLSDDQFNDLLETLTKSEGA
jgi:hypothetical protein